MKKYIICKGYNTCPSKDNCSHSKQHEVIGKNIIHKDGSCIKGDSSDCHCNEIYLRAIKLKKLQNEN